MKFIFLAFVVKAEDHKPMESGCYFDAFPMDFVFLSTGKARISVDYMSGGSATGVYYVCEYSYVNKKEVSI